MKHLKLTTLAATAAIALAPIAQAETLRHAVGSAGVSGLIDGTQAWADYIKEQTGGETEIKMASPTAALSCRPITAPSCLMPTC